jgi:hypothetical protein
MNALQDRRIVAALGAAAALLLAILIGVFVTHGHRRQDATPASLQAAAAGLQIQSGQADSSTASTKPLRCFVGGQFTGMAMVADCAKKNGISAQALDVGLDPATGAVTAASGSLAPPLQPLSAPAPAAEPEARAEQDQPAPPAPAPGDCLRYTPDGWRSAGAGLTLAQCTRTLFEGRCERPGDALYGRWGQQTLRLVPGRVEMSADNRNFHPLVPQNPQDCSLPAG